MDFEPAYRDFLHEHTSRREGERLRRLQEGHGYAERLFLQAVWWPAFHNLRHLHPEYEVVDFDGHYRYVDFAYLRGHIRLAIEIDGYAPHVSRVDRRQFVQQLRRQNQLILDGWSVLRFALDEVKEQPRSCQRVLLQFLGRWSEDEDFAGLGFMERAIVRLGLTSRRPLTPRQVRTHLGIGWRVASKLLKRLVEEEWLEPAAGQQRIRSYRINPKRTLR